MQVGGPLPINIARAYNLPRNAGQVGPVAQPAPAKGIDTLVAGKTNQPMSFDASPAKPISGGATLQLYTRAADRIEAATGIAIGKSLDVTG
jgi:hypothetical protein